MGSSSAPSSSSNSSSQVIFCLLRTFFRTGREKGIDNDDDNGNERFRGVVRAAESDDDWKSEMMLEYSISGSRWLVDLFPAGVWV